MNISIKASQIELTPALKDYTEKRLGAITKYVGTDVQIMAEIGKTTDHHKNGDIFRAEANVTTSLGKQYRAVSEKSDLYEAIDDVRSELIREITSAKGKKEALWRRGAQRIKNILKGL